MGDELEKTSVTEEAVGVPQESVTTEKTQEEFADTDAVQSAPEGDEQPE